MLLVFLMCSLTLSAVGQQMDDDWLDPYDMLNYDASTKTMKKPSEVGPRYTEQVVFFSVASLKPPTPL